MVRVDEIMRLTAISAGTVQTILVELEQAGAVISDSADRVSLKPRA